MPSVYLVYKISLLLTQERLSDIAYSVALGRMSTAIEVEISSLLLDQHVTILGDLHQAMPNGRTYP